MITTHAYLVAYPNPTIPLHMRAKRLDIDSDADGKELLGLLRSAYPGYSGDLEHATLWKASGLPAAYIKSSDEMYKWIRKTDPGVVIPPDQTLATLFPQGPHEAIERQVDIVAVTPEIVDAAELQADVDGNLGHMKTRAALSKTMRNIGSPSETVESTADIRGFVEVPNGPRYGRPSDRFGPPTALFSPELALLKYDLEHLEGFTPGSIGAKYAFELIENSTNFFDKRGEREATLRPILRRLLVGEGQWQALITGGPNEVRLEETFSYPIVEVTDELGLGGDPSLQGLVVYSRALAQEKCRPFLDRSNLPVVLLAIAGNHLVVSTAIYTDSIYADKLLSMDLRFGPHASDNVLCVARVFMAIKECTERLRRLYGNLISATNSTPPARVLWPNPTSHPPESTEVVPVLEFFSKADRSVGTPLSQVVIDEENKRHAMYLARMQTEGGTSTKNVFVKFTAKYNPTAHHLLANHKPPLAPVLHSCTRVIGDMFMVVMQYLPGTSLLDVPLPLPASAHEAVHRDVSRALELLHGHDLVFGDLREANLLYLPEEGGHVLLVDFDSVGRDGEDRYPACLNSDAGLGVDRLQIMEKSHDIENFGRLMDRLSREL